MFQEYLPKIRILTREFLINHPLSNKLALVEWEVLTAVIKIGTTVIWWLFLTNFCEFLDHPKGGMLLSSNKLAFQIHQEGLIVHGGNECRLKSSAFGSGIQQAESSYASSLIGEQDIFDFFVHVAIDFLREILR